MAGSSRGIAERTPVRCGTRGQAQGWCTTSDIRWERRRLDVEGASTRQLTVGASTILSIIGQV